MSGTISELAVAVERAWRAGGVTVRAGVSAEAIAVHERRIGHSLPPAVAAYFRAIDGMEDAEWDSDLIHFWPLDETSVDEGDLLIFADYSLDVHSYGVRLGGLDEVFVIGAGAPERIAASFCEFLETYLSEPLRLFRVTPRVPQRPG